jgi:hypothetical protein
VTITSSSVSTFVVSTAAGTANPKYFQKNYSRRDIWGVSDNLFNINCGRYSDISNKYTGHEQNAV